MFRQIDPRQYAAIRIAFGILTFLSLAGLFPEATFSYSDAGWFPVRTAMEMINHREWTLLHTITSPWAVKIFFLVVMAASLSLTAGFKSRLSALACFVGVVSLQSRNCLNTYGGDEVIRLMLLYLVLSPSGAAWSVDRFLDKEAGIKRRVDSAVWPLWLMQFQVCVIYFASGWAKFHGTEWIDGTAVEYMLMHPTFVRWDFSFMRHYPWMKVLTQGLSWGTVAWELAFPFLILQRHGRAIALAVGVFMHLGLMVTLQIHWFGQLMLATYLAFLPNEWFAIAEKLAAPKLKPMRSFCASRASRWLRALQALRYTRPQSP